MKMSTKGFDEDNYRDIFSEAWI